jgi:hypothetical protein
VPYQLQLDDSTVDFQCVVFDAAIDSSFKISTWMAKKIQNAGKLGEHVVDSLRLDLLHLDLLIR